jgi:hypothetical protein
MFLVVIISTPFWSRFYHPQQGNLFQESGYSCSPIAPIAFLPLPFMADSSSLL